jgi:hypothetical protein
MPARSATGRRPTGSRRRSSRACDSPPQVPRLATVSRARGPSDGPCRAPWWCARAAAHRGPEGRTTWPSRS